LTDRSQPTLPWQGWLAPPTPRAGLHDAYRSMTGHEQHVGAAPDTGKGPRQERE